jgi:hypothetical protein
MGRLAALTIDIKIVGYPPRSMRIGRLSFSFGT